MNLIEFLIQRQSTPAKYLIEPAPSHEELQQLMAAAESAPDHGALKPWRFMVISGSARDALGHLFVQALLQRAPETELALQERERERALRAPMLIAAIARLDNQPQGACYRTTGGCGSRNTTTDAGCQPFRLWNGLAHRQSSL